MRVTGYGRLRPLQRVCEASGDPVPGAVSSVWPDKPREAMPFIDARAFDPATGARRNVGYGHDGHGDRRRGARPLHGRVHRLHAAKRGTRFEALEPIRQGIRERFGGIGEGVARGLRLRHDHGSNYLADDFQQEVAFFGIESSPSFVREPEGNGVAERFIRTLKENLLWVRSFATIEELRLALLAFKRTYNEQWMLEKYDYRSPAQVRRDLVGLDAAA